VRYGLLAWTRVSADSEKCRGSQWAVKVGQRLPLRFGQSGAARELGLVQIVVQASAIRGGFPNTWPTQPVFGWRCRSVLGDYGKGPAIRTAGYTLCNRETMACSCAHEFIARRSAGQPLFGCCECSPEPSPEERWKVAFRSMFLREKGLQRFGASSFSKFY